MLGQHFSLSAWIQQLRVRQYTKNVLVFVPALTAHAFAPSALYSSLLAFLAFCLCASAAYVINDMADVAADREHPVKRQRPQARGSITPRAARIGAAMLLACAFLVAATISLRFALVLAAYFAAATAYTFWLKRKLFIDVVVLSLLYALRVIGGAEAIGVAPSEWLLVFSMLIFTSLALIKRYAELVHRPAAAVPIASTRDYKLQDLGILAAMAAAAGFNAVTVFALYVSSDAARYYSRPELLWLVCPILLYWIGRALVLTHRGVMDEDPIVFVLKDWISLLTVAAIVALTVAAI